MSKKSNKKKIIIAVVVVLIVALALRTAFKPKVDNYKGETVKTQDITTYYTFSGNIAPKESQMVASKTMLPIKKLYVKEGDIVKKGDILFILDDSNIAANIEQSAAGVEIANINYEKMNSTAKDQQLAQVSNALTTSQLNYDDAKANLDRMTELFNGESISKQALEQAQSAFDMAKVQLESAQENYSVTERSIEQNTRTAKEQLRQAEASYESVKKQVGDLSVTAEIDGVISEIFVKENESLVTGSQIMEIVDYDDLEILVKVDEYDIGSITVGKEVSVTINTLDKDVIGTISKISNQAQTISGVSFFTANIDLEKDEDLRVGLSAEVKVLNKQAISATTIFMKALQFDHENSPYVYYRDANNVVVTKPVVLGINDGNIVQILDGVKSGEEILYPAGMPQFVPGVGMVEGN